MNSCPYYLFTSLQKLEKKIKTFWLITQIRKAKVRPKRRPQHKANRRQRGFEMTSCHVDPSSALWRRLARFNETINLITLREMAPHHAAIAIA